MFGHNHNKLQERNRPELCRLKDVPKPKLTGSKTRTTEGIFDVSRDSHVLQNTVLGCKPQEVRVKIAEEHGLKPGWLTIQNGAREDLETEPFGFHAYELNIS